MQFSTEEQFQEELAKIPAFNIYRQNLAELFNQDKSKLTQDEITKLYFEKAKIVPHFIAEIESSALNLLSVFRGRIINESEDTTLINTFSYPHQAICKKNGRANIINKPVFYCADNPMTAILECKPKSGTVIFLSAWKIACDRKVQYTSFINPDVKTSNPWYDHAQRVSNFQIMQASKSASSKANELKLLLEFNSEIFVREEDNYPLTSWLCNQSLYRFDGIDFLVYPSITTETYTCNMAFHPNFVDKYFIFDRVYQVRFNGKIGDEFSANVRNVGKIIRTQIEWGSLDADDFDILPNMTKTVNR